MERTYNVPLRREWLKVPKYKRSKKAVKALKEFLVRHMKSENIKLGVHLNEQIWQHGIKNPPHHVQINVVKDEEGIVYAELPGFEMPIKKEDKKESKKEKKSEKEVKDMLGDKEEKVEKKETPKSETTGKKEATKKAENTEKKEKPKEEKKEIKTEPGKIPKEEVKKEKTEAKKESPKPEK